MIDFRIKPNGYNQGIYKIPFKEYQSIQALNSSKLKAMAKTPAHFKAMVEEPEAPVSPQLQKAFARGSAFDILMLDGKKKFDEMTAINPGHHKNSKIYKAWEQKNKGKIILDKGEYSKTLEMQKAANKKKCFSEIMSGGKSHLALIWQCKVTGLWCKAEIDYITDNGIIIDIKTTMDAGFWSFSRSAIRYGYINQLAHYLDGISIITGIQHTEAYLAVVEKEPPFESHIFEPSSTQLYDAHDENLDRKYRIYDCLTSGNWPGYQDEIISLDNGLYKTENI